MVAKTDCRVDICIAKGALFSYYLNESELY